MTLRQTYGQLAHAMQSAVAFLLNYPREAESLTSPKSLRVGVNAAMSDQGGLADLLIEKGIITHEEYVAAVTKSMKREVDSLTARAREASGLGDKISFG